MKMTGSQRRKAWKLFERFVADLERQLQGSGVVITCPDKIKDPDGNQREVDCSIRGFMGDEPFLHVIECRDRKGGTDIQWIDAIESKGRDLAADRIVAVHCKRLSIGARKKAKRVGIEVRQLGPRLGESPFPKIHGFFVQRLAWRPLRAHVTLEGVASLPPALLDEIWSVMRHEGEAKPYRDPRSVESFNLRGFVDNIVNESHPIPYIGPAREKLVLTVRSTSALTFRYCINDVDAKITKLEVELEVLRVQSGMEHERSGHYVAPDVGLDNDVDQYVLVQSEKLVTAAGMTTVTPIGDGQQKTIEHSITFSEGVNFDLQLDQAMERLLGKQG